MSGTRQIVVNGERQALEAATVAELAERMGCAPDRPGVAIALNGRVVPRSAWGRRRLAPGDEVEIVGAAQGG